jgi:hypothetical protein
MTVDIDAGKKAEGQPGYVAQLQATLNVIPVHTESGTFTGMRNRVRRRSVARRENVRNCQLS